MQEATHTQEYYSTWYDLEFKIHDKPIDHNGVQTSENPNLITAADLELIRRRNTELHKVRKKYYYEHAMLKLVAPDNGRKWRRHTAGKFGEHFSFDEMLGVYSFCTKEQRRKLPLWWYKNGRPYVRLEIIFLLASKYDLLMCLLLPFFAIQMMISINRAPEHMGGAQKWFIRCSMMPEVFFRFTSWYLKKKGYSWYDVFYGYYKTYNPDPDLHPIVAKSKSILQLFSRQFFSRYETN